jgi:NAD(P)-dependent dehydrogenase (short-subunit alcohol dehydrogenase family)
MAMAGEIQDKVCLIAGASGAIGSAVAQRFHQEGARLALFLASSRSDGLVGRLISGVHDRWEGFPGKISEIMNAEGGTLRRVPLD